MDSKVGELNVFFFPLMAPGHMIPTLDMAKLFASRGLKPTIITTPLNASCFFKQLVERAKKNSGFEIHIKTIKFPSLEAGLPEGCENLDFIPSESDGEKNENLPTKFMNAIKMLQQPLEDLLQEYKPDCVVADMFFPWATEAAAKFGIPRLVFHGTGLFSLCASESVARYEPHKKVLLDSEPFQLPNLPGNIMLTRKQLPYAETEESEMTKLLQESRESELTSFGVIVNSFYELESAYADHYTNVLGRRAWHVGPLLLCNKDIEDKTQRGKNASLDRYECLKWLDSKKPNSVLYICFGSMTNFSDTQLMEIAFALEDSGQDFIWVVRKTKSQPDKEEWLPESFEKRMEGKGLIIRGWAQQVLILEHESTGGFVTHCGWNSILEGISAGVPMVTWPVFAEQFYNEKLVTQVLKTGIAVGVQQWTFCGDFVKRESILKVVKAIMVDDEMRNKAIELSQMANKAVENGGSSYSDLDRLIEELSLIRR